jgi:hypothetical protein
MPDVQYFREQAKRCRERAKTASDAEIADELLFLADRYEEFADELEKRAALDADDRGI